LSQPYCIPLRERILFVIQLLFVDFFDDLVDFEKGCLAFLYRENLDRSMQVVLFYFRSTYEDGGMG